MRPAEPVALDRRMLTGWSLPVDEGGDKHSRGTVLVIGGSATTVGAVLLAGMSALRMGAGRLQIATAAEATIPLGVAVPEALVMPLPMHADGTIRPRKAIAALRPLASSADAVLIGSGLRGDCAEATAEFVAGIAALTSPTALVVLDAAALEDLGSFDGERSCAGRLILTPNRQEARQLAGVSPTADQGAAEETEMLLALAAEHDAVLTSFGLVAGSDGRCWRAPDGGPGLGTSGSGDVLAGLVVGAAARCGDPAQAACWATYVHSMVGQGLSARMGRLGFLARDLVEEVPQVMRDLDAPT